MIDALYRDHARAIILAVMRAGAADFERAEAAVQEAFLEASQRWGDAPPDNPQGWLYRVARNRSLDMARRDQRRRRLREQLPQPAALPAPEATLSGEWDDELVAMILAVCDPALTPDEQVAFAMRSLCGVELRSIAVIFRTRPPVIRKRLQRAREKLRASPPQVPTPDEAAPRMDSVLRVLYAVFTEGHRPRTGADQLRVDLTEDAIRLGEVVARRVDDPRLQALLALMKLQAARLPARVEAWSPLQEQDRSRWDRGLIAEGLRHLQASAAGDALHPLHLEAAIAACHSLAPSFERTDWERILSSYALLLKARPSPVVALNRAMALGFGRGPEAGLAALEEVTGGEALPAWHAGRAELLTRAGQPEAASEAWRRAAALADSQASAAYFEGRGMSIAATTSTDQP